LDRTTDYLVIGGGSTGTSILFNLAKQGHTNSLLVDRGTQIAAGQTSKSTALVRTHYSDPTVAKMALLSFRFFQKFEEHVDGAGCGFRETGLLVCADQRFEKGLSANLKMFKEIGIVSNLIDMDEAKRIEPQLRTDTFTAIAYEPQTGYAEPALTASAFASAAIARGASVQLGTEVTNVRKSSGSGLLVETTNGDIRAGKVVIASGVWSEKLFKKLGIDVPLWVVRHPVAVFRRPEEYSGNRPLIFDFPREFYYKPEGQTLFFAGSLESELDKAHMDPDNYPVDVSFEEVMKYSEGLAQVLPTLAEKGVFQSSYTGLYDMTPDQQMIIDEFSSDGYEGLYSCVGLSGHGFKLCPEFGRILSALMVDGRFPDYDVSIFGRNRFERGTTFSSKYPLSTVA
jgi:glycine/D-amino acid oxidase-like deaminating enzyme